MIKIKVVEEIDDIKNKLLPLKDEVCIIKNRREGDCFIVTFDANQQYIESHLSVISVEGFNESKKVELILSDEDMQVFGNPNLINSATL